MARTITQQLESYLVRLARRRKNSTVTADDAHKYLDTQNVNGSRKTLIHQVFNSGTSRFVATGSVNSERPVARGRKITAWELTA